MQHFQQQLEEIVNKINFIESRRIKFGKFLRKINSDFKIGPNEEISDVQITDTESLGLGHNIVYFRQCNWHLQKFDEFKMEVKGREMPILKSKDGSIMPLNRNKVLWKNQVLLFLNSNLFFHSSSMASLCSFFNLIFTFLPSKFTYPLSKLDLSIYPPLNIAL